MISKEQILAKLQKHWNHAVEAGYNPDRFLGIFLYGSQNYHMANENSDIDIYYEGKADILLRSQMKMELEKILQCPVDIVRKRERQENSDFEIQVNQDIIYV